ncbi:APC family permease [Mollicutes bacterium LVI A0039]|nr:APC family permease [Mollicutes bacterium LVI A0039]
MDKKKKFRLVDAVLMSVVVVLVVESTASSAAIGPSQFFWWIFLLICFFLPYGLISSELGTTYDGEGGLYDWVKKAYGRRAGGRVAWYYWINYPIWMVSLAILFTDTGAQIFGLEANSIVVVLIQLIFVWVVCLVSLSKISDAKWILNSAAFMKAFIMLSLGGLGIYTAINHGVANEFTLQTMTPTFDSSSLAFLSVLIFNFMGFEVVASMAPEMDNPQRDIPKALVLGGSLIALFYMVGAFGMSAAIPVSEISPDAGLLDSFSALTTSNIFIIIIGLMFMYTLASNLISWAYGVNYVAMYCAEDGALPKIFAKRLKSNDMPLGAVLVNGVMASVLILIIPFIDNQDIFWSFFALNVVTLLASYLYMFPAFLKLRKVDPTTERPFRVKGSDGFLKLITFMPFVLIILTVILTLIPLPDLISGGPAAFMEAIPGYIPLILGSIAAFICGEVIVSKCIKKGEK